MTREQHGFCLLLSASLDEFMKWFLALFLAIGGIVLGIIVGLIIGYRRVIREYLNQTRSGQREVE